MGALFNRKWALTVSTLEVDAFAIHFRVEKTIKPEPNKVTIEVWNLNDDHRAALQELAPGKRVFHRVICGEDRYQARDVEQAKDGTLRYDEPKRAAVLGGRRSRKLSQRYWCDWAIT